MVVDDRFVSRTHYIGWSSGGFLCMQLDWTNLTKNLAILLLSPRRELPSLLLPPNLCKSIEISTRSGGDLKTTMTHTVLEVTLTNLIGGITKLWQLIFTVLMINGRSRSSAPEVVRLSDK